MALDPCNQDVTFYQNNEANIKLTKYLYVIDIDKLPPNAPKPIGKHVQINCFVESYYVCDEVNRISHTGKVLYFNSAPIVFYSKWENMVERSQSKSQQSKSQWDHSQENLPQQPRNPPIYAWSSSDF